MEGTIRLMNALIPFDTNVLIKTDRTHAHGKLNGLEELAKVFKRKLHPYEYEEALRHYLPDTVILRKPKRVVKGKNSRTLPKVNRRYE